MQSCHQDPNMMRVIYLPGESLLHVRARRSVAAYFCGCEVFSGVRVQTDPPHLLLSPYNASALHICLCLSLSLSLSQFRKWFRVQSDIILERFQEFLKTQSDRPVQFISNEQLWQAVLTLIPQTEPGTCADILKGRGSSEKKGTSHIFFFFFQTKR